MYIHIKRVGRSSVDGIATGRCGDRIPVGTRLSAPVQTGRGAHPTSYTMGTGSFLGVKEPGRDVDHPPPSSPEVKEGVELYLYSPSGPTWPVNLTFTFTYKKHINVRQNNVAACVVG